MALTLLSWLGLSAGLILVTEAGYRLSRRVRRRYGREAPDEGTSAVLTATLGLLGLLTAFVFSLAAERYEIRRALVVDEANAISTAFLRQQLLPEPHRAALTRAMADYARARRAFVEAGADRAAILDAEARTDAAEARVWAATGAALRTPEGAQLTVPLLDATNTMFDLAASRHAALDARVPARALRVLVLYAAGAAFMMGHFLAAGRRHLLSTAGLFTLVALAVSLVFDLDSPRRGAVRVPVAPMDRVIDQVLAAAEAPPR